MHKEKAFYYTTTGVFVVLMAASAVMHLFHLEPIASGMRALGYPAYFSTLLAVAKLFGISALVGPVSHRLREWAYAGFAFDCGGAFWSQLAAGQSVIATLLISALLAASYFCWTRRTYATVE